MASLGDLFVTVGAKIEGFEKAFSTIDQNLKAADREAKKVGDGFVAMGQRMSSVGTTLTASITAPIAGLGLAVANVAGKFEQTEAAFRNFLGSADAATKFLAELKAFAAATPFEFTGLTESAKRMMAFGFEAAQVIPMLRIIGDAVAGIGGGAAEIDRVTLALGQMQAKGKVSAEEMNQLAELGIPAWRMLADQIGVSIPQAMKMAENGAISAAEAIPAILAGMNAKFEGLMDEQSKTLLGMWSNLKDQITFTLMDLGKVLIPAFKDILQASMPLLEALKSMAMAFAAMDPETQKVIVTMVGLAAAVGPVLVVVGQLAIAIGGLMSAKVALTGATAALTAKLGPVAGAVVGLKGVVVALAAVINGVALSAARDFGEYLGGRLAAALGMTRNMLDGVKASAIATGAATQKAMGDQGWATMQAAEASRKLGDEQRRLAAEQAELERQLRIKIEAQQASAEAARQQEERARQLQERIATLRSENAAFISKLSELQAQMGSTASVMNDMSLDAEVLTERINKANASTDAIRNLSVPAWMEIKTAVGEVPPELEKVTEEIGKQPEQWDKMGKQISTIVTRFSQDIAKSLWDGDMSWGEKTKSMLKDIGAAVTSAFIEPAMNAITGFITNTIMGALKGAFDQVGSWLGSLGSKMAGIFGGGASGAAGGIGGAAGSAGGAAGGVGRAVGGGFTGILGAIGSLGSMVSGIFGNFQMAGMNKTLDLIEWNTRKASLHLEHIFTPIYDLTNDFRARWQGGLGIFNQEGDSGIRIAPYEFGAFPVAFADGLGGVSVTVQGNVIGNDEFVRELATAVAEELRLQGAA